MITIVVTANGRGDLLKRTLDSFNEFNTYKDVDIIIRDDSRDHLGQVRSIDEIYKHIKTEYFFHLEEDWCFYRGGFIEKSLAILESNPKIFTVWLRGVDDTNTHPVETGKSFCIYDAELQNKITDYYYMAVNALGGNWHGFTWNPGLRRLRDYYLVSPFAGFIRDGDFAALTECRIGQKYFELGYRAVTLPEMYVKHIG